MLILILILILVPTNLLISVKFITIKKGQSLYYYWLRYFFLQKMMNRLAESFLCGTQMEKSTIQQRQNGGKPTLTIGNPIYYKLQKIFYSLQREKQLQQKIYQYRGVAIHQQNLQRIRQQKNVRILRQNNKISQYLQNGAIFTTNNNNICDENENKSIFTKNELKKGLISIEKYNNQNNQNRMVTMSLSTDGESMCVIKNKENITDDRMDLMKIKIQNHTLKKVKKPQISVIDHDKCQIQNGNINIKGQDLFFATIIDQKAFQTNPKTIQNVQPLTKQIPLTSNQQKLTPYKLEQKLHYYQKMQQFYLYQIQSYRQDKRILQWKLKLIVQELIENKKNQRKYVSEPYGFGYNGGNIVICRKKNESMCEGDCCMEQRDGLVVIGEKCLENSQQDKKQIILEEQLIHSKSVSDCNVNISHFFSQYQMISEDSFTAQKNERKSESVNSHVKIDDHYLIFSEIEPINHFAGLKSSIYVNLQNLKLVQSQNQDNQQQIPSTLINFHKVSSHTLTST